MRAYRPWRVRALALASAVALAQPVWAGPAVTLQPPGGPGDARWVNDPQRDPPLSRQQLIKLLRQRVKYVFVIFHENHSFDSEYGTFPGVNGLYADAGGPRDAAHTPGFIQRVTDGQGQRFETQPFRIGLENNSNVVDSVDHSHVGLATKLHVVGGQAQMDEFSQDEFTAKAGSSAGVPDSAGYRRARQYANLVMAHVDCDTIPFFWNWASRFTIFDNIFATEDTPSTPNAIAMISGQSGETQWVRHPALGPQATADGTTGPTSGVYLQNTGGGMPGANQGGGLTPVDEASAESTTQGPPIVNDPLPYYGSPYDATVAQGAVQRQPYGPYESLSPPNIASNLTYASLPLTLMGRDLARTLRGDLHPQVDLADIREDMAYVQKLGHKPVNWAWYQNGYGHEASDPQAAATHWAYVEHHDGPLYFGYLADNPEVARGEHFKGETQFFDDVALGRLPASGGVFYIRGGYVNQQGLSALYRNPALSETSTDTYTLAQAQALVAAAKNGDDDHPAYSDRQISEAMTAQAINAIASHPRLWAQSAIIITYDESDGYFDHVPPRILSYGPDGLPLSRGIRVPLILISPYARSHAVAHAEGDHNAVIQTINALFGLPALASLPDEAAALRAGNSPAFNRFGPPGFEQRYLGPHDINSPISESLLSGFDPRRLQGRSRALPASSAMIDPALVRALPHAMSCSSLGITPAAPASDRAVPAGFNNLPSTLPRLN